MKNYLFTFIISLFFPFILSAPGINPSVSELIKDNKLKLEFAVKTR